jgi:ATP-dependent exoDNAse (exonuclease V) beta subunit
MNVLVDQEARRRIAEDLETTLVVEAAAGTGKTTALVSRIVTILRRGLAPISQILATTFTEKAAGELVVRLREALEKALVSASPEEREHLRRATLELETARIGTIHGIAADLLREHPIEAGLDPAFRVLAEEESAQLLEACTSRWLEDALAQSRPGILRLSKRRLPYDTTLREAIVSGARGLADQRDMKASWSKPSFDAQKASNQALLAIEALRPDFANAPSGDFLTRTFEALFAMVDPFLASEKLRGSRDEDALVRLLSDIKKAEEKWWRGKTKMFGKQLRKDVLVRFDAAMDAVRHFTEESEAELAALLREELLEAVDVYEREKKARGLVDFADLLFLLRALLIESEPVRRSLGARFRFILVDEVQDTDPVQLDIVALLAAEDPRIDAPQLAKPKPGKLFVVGDPKQAIYRFRRADLDAYLESRERLRAHGAQVIHLQTSFRSQPAIQAAVNRAFATNEFGASMREYVALAKHRAASRTQPSVVVLPVPEPYGQWGKYYDGNIRDSYARGVGSFVRWMIESSGWKVTEGDAEVAIAPRHIAILFKKMGSGAWERSRAYVDALESHGISTKAGERRNFYQRDEVLAVHQVLSAIEWIDDELAVYAALTGPFLAFTDAELLAYQREHRSLEPLRVPKAIVLQSGQKASALEPVADALRLLKALHFGRHRRPIAETIERFLDATRAHVLLALEPHGERSLANVSHLIETARLAEARGVLSFRRFVEELEERTMEAKYTDVSVSDDTHEGVTISTVHGAKGLEFPIVILADPTARNSGDATRYTDRARGLHVERIAGLTPSELRAHAESVTRADDEEENRLLYVAATRARDLLVVPGGGDQSMQGWTTPLERALRPSSAMRPSEAPGCPPLGRGGLGDDTVGFRPSEVHDPDPLQPGLYTLAEGLDAVWWGPEALPRVTGERVALRRTDLLQKAENAGPNPKKAEREKIARKREARIEEAKALREEREPLGMLAEKPLAASAAECEVQAVRLVSLDLEALENAPRFEQLLRGALVVLAGGAETAPALRYVRRQLGLSDQSEALAAACVAQITGTQAWSDLRACAQIETDVWVTLATMTGSLGEGRVPVVTTEGDEVHVFGVALESDAEKRSLELALGATAVAKDRGLRARATLFVMA